MSRLKYEAWCSYESDDILRICRVALERGNLFIKPHKAADLWEDYSETMCAGWMNLPESDDELYNIIYGRVFE